jgi:creatinine amidohydrolase/Fe(II)-dependent formamide hydrolase-like protein
MIQSATTVDEAGAVVVEVWDLATELYTRTVDEVLVEERPMTAEEVALYGPPLEHLDNEGQLTIQSDEAVDKLVAVVESLNAITDLTNAEINQNPAAIIKDVARELKTVARQANREARLTSGRTESTDTGDVVDT